jgi:diaminopimelate decarboxylase
MTHTHVAGSIHADAGTRAPGWLGVPDDVNALLPGLWSAGVHKDVDGVLTAAGLDVAEIAERVGTPAYVIDEADLRARARAFAEAFEGWNVYYAAKSFLCTAVARWVTEEGLGLDTCTGGELAVAQRAGVDLSRVGLHGNNKSVAELRQGLEAGVGRIIVDSFDEIGRLGHLAGELGVRPRVMVRVTTGVEAHTHEYISTAHEDQKFGFSIAGGAAAEALGLCHLDPRLDLVGIHSHIGSQIFDAEGFEVAARRTLRLHADFAAAYGVELPELDLGGGFGIAYTSQDTPRRPPSWPRP